MEKDGKLSSAFICSALFLLGQARLKIILWLHAQDVVSGGEGEGRKEGCLGPNESFLKLLFIISLQSGNAQQKSSAFSFPGAVFLLCELKGMASTKK